MFRKRQRDDRANQYIRDRIHQAGWKLEKLNMI